MYLEEGGAHSRGALIRGNTVHAPEKLGTRESSLFLSRLKYFSKSLNAKAKNDKDESYSDQTDRQTTDKQNERQTDELNL